VEEQRSEDLRITIAFNVACIFKEERLQYA